MQVKIENKETGKHKRKNIGRLILRIKPYQQIAGFMKDMFGLLGGLSTYRVGKKIINLFTACKCNSMTILRSVRDYANKLTFKLSKEGTNQFEADGTGIPTLKSGKRGSELKSLFQRKENGKLHYLGSTIGKYKNLENWKKLFKPSLEKAEQIFEKIILSSDGDTTIWNAAKESVKDIENIIFQKDIWHVLHQLKYALWSNGVKKTKRKGMLKGVYNILYRMEDLPYKIRLKTLDRLINICEERELKRTVKYLNNSKEGLFTYEEEGNQKFTGLTERSMRTINQRVNVGVWSDEGALAVTQIRLAYYYNRITPSL